MSVVLYISLTCIGILGKLWGLAVVKRSWQWSDLYVMTAVLIAVALAQSTFELIIYSFDHISIAGKIALIGYYCCAFIMASILPFILAKIVRIKLPKLLLQLTILINVISLYLLTNTGAMIAGVDHTGITLTRVAGSYYWIFQLVVLLSMISSIGILIYGKKKSDGFVKIRANNVLLSFSFFAGFVIFIIIAMQFMEGINAAGILPICTTLFVMGVIDNVCNKNIVDYSYWIPFSKKRREINKLIKPFIEIQSDGLDPELKKAYNKLIAQHALELFDGNQTKAAEWLKVSQSWVSRNNKNDK